MNLNDDVKFVKGVGPNRVKLLNKIGIFTIKDLITYFPRDYENRSEIKNLCECINGEQTLVKAVVTSKVIETRLKGGRTMQKMLIRDESMGATIMWFNQPYLKNKFEIGQEYKFYGKIKKVSGKITINSPVFDDIKISNNTGRIVPIYPLTYQLTQNTIRKIIENVLKEILKIDILKETLPEYILNEYKLQNIKEAINKIHFPNNFEEFQKARQRLVFEELLLTQLALLQLKNTNIQERKGIKFKENIKMSDVINKLPFNLTKAQLKVLKEIDENMGSNKSMNRLLQGDVGSGKTVIAMIAAYKAVKSGYQTAILVPTAILAMQHLNNFKNILDKFQIKTEILISGIAKKKKEEILERLKNGDIDILIGTHAMLEENVIFNNLGLVVTDEQHRFGVKQRTKISKKGINPDILVMSATPIPRTLALILYGDLDISIIDELPPNRKKIQTFAVNKSMDERVNNFIKKQIEEGRQAYIVCPLVEESEESDLKSVISLYEKCKHEIFKNYKVEYIHGKMKQSQKDEIMLNFKQGKIDILISTTVIEVGVDVPNASVMVIEDAQRFGLARFTSIKRKSWKRRI